VERDERREHERKKPEEEEEEEQRPLLVCAGVVEAGKEVCHMYSTIACCLSLIEKVPSDFNNYAYETAIWRTVRGIF
jgi:hypothetical protein